MTFRVQQIRSVTAGGGGFAGDGAVWSESNPPPANTIFTIPLRQTYYPNVLCTGARGYIRVTGADAARRFTVRVFVRWVRFNISTGAETSDWRQLTQTDPRDMGDGDDFDTGTVLSMFDTQIAFHLVPVGGNLAAGSVVEIWGAEY